jgi:hypothetical protein
MRICLPHSQIWLSRASGQSLVSSPGPREYTLLPFLPRISQNTHLPFPLPLSPLNTHRYSPASLPPPRASCARRRRSSASSRCPRSPARRRRCCSTSASCSTRASSTSTSPWSCAGPCCSRDASSSSRSGSRRTSSSAPRNWEISSSPPILRSRSPCTSGLTCPTR